ncbi:MAG: SAM-dependent methyltransferase [Lachnospiraceae bacterium]|nr:SAM-dependent methyltransferase [Lachnospiraceae bacterium]
MENIREALEESINEQLYQATLSNGKNKELATKVKVRPILYKGALCFQVSSFVGAKVLHKNYDKKELIDFVIENMKENFKQLEIENVRLKVTVLVSKKGKITMKKKMNETEQKESLAQKIDLSHNRTKKYILEEGKPVDFLIDLGVQTKEGRTINARYDKFKQINRFLEFIQDVLPALKKKEQITILDFGCGKSYLTFAMYYYLKELQHMNIRIIGLDLKKDVIETCNNLSEKYGYDGLQFLQGDIGEYNGVTKVDMVVTLHACDTATDYALEKAIQWNASVILSVPCCQHEVNKQIHCKELQPLLKYGLIKERMAALITDAYRGNILEKCGYDTQILEFIDMEHTPKNILIRAVKKSSGNPWAEEIRSGKDQTAQDSEARERDALTKLEKMLHIDPTLGRLVERIDSKRTENRK